jgi:DNA-binding response OmpR family regulator
MTAAAASTHPRVVLVDDSETTLESVAIVLEGAGMEVIKLSNPLSLPAVIRKEDPDLVLLDVTMPALSGDAIVSVLGSKANRRARIVLHSSLDAEVLGTKARTCGADAYILKTNDEEELIRQVRRCLEGQTKRRAI